VTLGDGKLFGVKSSTLVALDARSGTQRWTYDLGERDSYDPPAYGNGTVFMQTGGHQNSFVWAIASADGALRWRTAYGNQWSAWYAPTVVGQRVYVAAGYYGGLEAYDASTGTRVWAAPTSQYDQWTPAVSNGLVYAYTGSYAPQVGVFDASTGAARYSIADPRFDWRGWSMNLAPVLGDQNDLIALPDNRLVAFDLGSRSIRWEVKGFSSNYMQPTQVTVADGVIYAFNGTQVQAHRESDGSKLWTWPLPGGTTYGTMIATTNLLFVSSSTTTYALDIASHRVVWSYPAAGLLAMGANGVLYIAASDRVVAVSMR
jgi:outer membrane protein assembly factor BamB